MRNRHVIERIHERFNLLITDAQIDLYVKGIQTRKIPIFHKIGDTGSSVHRIQLTTQVTIYAIYDPRYSKIVTVISYQQFVDRFLTKKYYRR